MRIPLVRRTYHYLRRVTAPRRARQQFRREYVAFHRMSAASHRLAVSWEERLPCLGDRTGTHAFDAHYVYHPAWAARVLAKTRPEYHVDISSLLHFCTLVSAFIPVRFYDYRPAALRLENPAPRVAVGEPWQIRVRFEVNRPVEHLIVAVGLVTPYDLPVQTTWSTPCRLSRGVFEAVLRQETVKQEPGFYPVIIGVSEYDWAIHYVEKAGTLLIAEAFDFATVRDLHRARHCGLVLNQMPVTVEQVPAGR